MNGNMGVAANLTKSAAVAGVTWMAWNPKTTSYAAVAATGAAAIFAPAAVAVPVLNAVGFTSGGVAASSVAATVHSFIGIVGAGSVFAMAQSAGAGGAGLATANMVVQGAGIAVVAAGGALARSK